jgi:hypothetical protein
VSLAAAQSFRPTAAEAEVVRRIFRDFNSGLSLRTIAHTLNREGSPGPHGSTWGPSTIYGNWRRRTGILNNELYIGRLVWNRQRYEKDPETGKRMARPNDERAWIVREVPALPIRRDVLEASVLESLKSHLVHPDLVRELIAEYHAELNRLAAGADKKKASLTEEVSAVPEPAPRLHPNLAEVYRQKVADPHASLTREDTRAESSAALRELIDAIWLVPEDGALQIELEGDLTAVLALGTNEQARRPQSGLLRMLVAGAGNHRRFTRKLNV